MTTFTNIFPILICFINPIKIQGGSLCFILQASLKAMLLSFKLHQTSLVTTEMLQNGF